MSTPRFYHPDLTAGRLLLSPEESAHARKSRRLRPGDPVILFDGQGRQAAGRILTAARAVEVDLDPPQIRPWPGPRLTIAAALPKSPRQDVLIEKCTELGVWAVWGVEFERGVVKPSAARRDKWNRTAIQAAKQSARTWLPKLELPVPFDEFITRIPNFDRCFIGDPAADPLSPADFAAADSLLAVIGPEGGFTDAESSALHAAGGRPVAWGRFILRIETAAIAAAAILR